MRVVVSELLAFLCALCATAHFSSAAARAQRRTAPRAVQEAGRGQLLLLQQSRRYLSANASACASHKTQLACDLHPLECRWDRQTRRCGSKSTPPPGPPPAPPPAPPTPSPWAAWTWDANKTVYHDPSFGGAGVASDPAVLYDSVAKLYRMYYTCIDSNPAPVNFHLLICSATSPDGSSWTVAQGSKGGYSKQVEGVALDWQNAWYTDLETAYVYLDETERLGKGLRWVMYADGYVRPKTGDVRSSRTHE